MPSIHIFPLELPPLTASAKDKVGFKTAVTSVVGVGGKETTGFEAAFSCTGTTGAGEGAGAGAAVPESAVVDWEVSWRIANDGLIFNCAEVVFTGCLNGSTIGVRADPEVNMG